MAKYLTDRQDRKLEEIIRKVDGLTIPSNRFPNASVLSTGTDFGTAIVPRSTIPAVTRTVQAGSDKFEPGVGKAYLFRIATGGEIEPRVDNVGNVIVRTVYNFSTQEFKSNDSSLELQASPVVLDMQDGSTFDLQSDLGSTDYIGPETLVPFAVMDRSGKLIIPADIQGTGTSTSKIARVGSTKIDAFNSGTFTPGTGTVEVWEFTNGAIADTLTTLTAFNTASYDIPTDEFILIEQEVGDDRWMIVAPGENLIKGFSGPQGSETFFPYDTLQVFGDRDAGVAVGEIITVNISKAGSVLGVRIDAKGDLVNFRDDQSPGQTTIPITLGETIDLVFGGIDKTATMTAKFAEWRLSANKIEHFYGKVFDVTGDTGDVDAYPLETLDIVGAGGTSVAVTKPDASTVRATITAGSSAKIAKNGGTPIPAFDGVDTPGGPINVVVYDFVNGTIAADETVEAWNMYDYPVPANEWIMIRPEASTGRWIVDMDIQHEIQGFSPGSDGNETLLPYETLVISGDRDENPVVGNIIDVTISAIGSGVKVKIDATGGLFTINDQVPTQEIIELGGCLTFDTNVSWANFIIDPGSGPNPDIVLTFGDLGTIEDDSAGSESFVGGDTIEFTNSVVTKAADKITVDITGIAADGKVKVRTTDARDFLEDQFLDHITDGDADRFKSAEDPLVEFQTDPTTAGLEQLRGFINSSDITGYSASGELHLALDTNVLKWIAPSAAITWTAAGDSGVNQTISGGDTLTLTGSSGAAAAAAGDRGVTTVGTATDVMVLSVDATVLQSFDLSGTATSGTDPVLVSAGTRNQIQIISNTASTVEEAGSKGWIQVVGGAGSIELILHEQTTSGYSFCVDGDQGPIQVINNTNTLLILGSNLTAAAAQADRGIVSVASAVDTITLSVDQTVHQKTTLSGTGSSGTTPVLISAGTRNELELISGGNATTVTSGAVGHVEVKGDATGGVEFILHERALATFCVDADQGGTPAITEGDTLTLQGSNLTAAVAQADRGIVTVANAGADRVEFSVDQTVHQKTALSGAGTSGTSPVLISDGTRNQLNLVSGGAATTVQELGSTGWVQIAGNASGCIELILHEQATTGYSFCVDGDQGPIQVISDTDTLLILGSNLTAAAAQADRGIVSVASSVDTITLSVDQTVLQSFDLSGTATSGTDPVLVSAGTRNQIQLISNTASTVEEAGSKGWIQIVGGAGTIELILHEQTTSGYSFCASGDKGSTQIITDANTLNFAGSNLTAASVQARRGVITTGVATDIIQISVDETVTQEINVTGTATTGTSLIQASAGTRNRFDFVSNTASTVEEAGSKGWIELKGDAIGGIEFILHEQTTSGYSFCIDGDQGPIQVITDTNTVLILGSNLTAAAAQADRGIVSVASATDTITLSVDQTVHQKTALSGAGSSGTTPVLISAGTRNQLKLISGGNATTVTSGATGHVEIKGDVTGGVEFILHERSLATFCVDADQGGTPAITEGDTLTLEGSNLTAAVLQADRGIVTVANAGADRVEFSVDQTVLQKIDLQGSATSGTDPVLVSDGTRNQLNVIANGSSGTVEEAASKGWIEVKGDVTGGIEFILHEQLANDYSFSIDGDQGPAQTITDANTVLILGSNLTAAALQADRGIVSVASSVDTITLSVDQSVHQKTNLSGTAVTGTTNVLISAGTRNQLNLISSCTSAVEESGSKGWIELKGGINGDVEFILHEQLAGQYEFIAAGDKGSPQTIADADTLTLEGSNLIAASLRADRGIVTTATATDTIEISIDQSVMTEFLLSGSGQTGDTNVFVKDGARNQVEIVSSNTPVQSAGDGFIEIKGSTSTIELILHQQALADAFPIGAIIESHKAPILSGGKRYIDRGGAADTNWAWMDGTSNASPGSGHDRRNYFVRGTSSTAAVTNTAFGRSEASSTSDDDEVTIAIVVDDHVNHIHQFGTDACHDVVPGADVHFDFSTSATKCTTIQKATNGDSLTLEHTEVVTITNNSATPPANVEMLPAFKKTHYFERV